MTITETINNLINKSNVEVGSNGKYYTYEGIVESSVMEEVYSAFQFGSLKVSGNYYYATKEGCSVAFKFKAGDGNATVCQFTFADER